ncbi:MAM and LDL-receptor class A domain-containing protein 1 isoform X1 [Rhipicephalus microplus]|uniref:MAM and LDL-receptor class A domain-containing protein 1 isoform X1 n=1 Tax=Rhipicephalus microplus TaxID=6941 RepID=UPI002376486D
MSSVVLWMSVCYCVGIVTAEETDCGFEIPGDDVTQRVGSEGWSSVTTVSAAVLSTNRTSRREDRTPEGHRQDDGVSTNVTNMTAPTTTTELPFLLDVAPTVTSLIERDESVVLPVATTQESVTSTPETPLADTKLERDFLQREKRQDEEEEEEVEKFIVKPEPCDFGQAEEVSLCDWTNYFNATPKMAWKPGKGDTALWLGGPRTDHTLNTGEGGYVFFETSFHERPGPSIVGSGDASSSAGDAAAGTADPPAPTASAAVTTRAPEVRQYLYESVVLATRNITPTGPMGFCVSFFYALEGLSVDRLKVVIMDAETQDNITVWESQDNYDGRWTKGEVAYTYGDVHQVWFEAVPKPRGDPARKFRGYIALDDILFDRMEEAGDNCLGHCTFEGGYCGWQNADTDDDFNWEQGRGSQSFLTGPSRDYSSFGKDEMTGGYIFIDSSFPRRPLDRARLISPTLKATGANLPMCMRFATHMFGNGIGTLRVLQHAEGAETPPRPIWEISGEAGNSWHLAQVQVATTEPFTLILEASVGANSLGNIAIDNISFRVGTCPISPQTAARNSGDCNFEEDTCGWTNPHPADGLDDLDWTRQYSYGVNGPPADHTKRKPDGYYMNLASSSHLPQRGGSKAWLVSPKLGPDSALPRCISFAYYMFERTIDPAGPSLGSLRVHVLRDAAPGLFSLQTVWRLNNHQASRWLVARCPIKLPDGNPINEAYQVVLEGIWGHGRVGYVAVDDVSFFDGDCNTFPEKAKAIPGECSFERDMCGWTNHTDTAPTTNLVGRVGSAPRDSLTWRLASVVSRPANLQDHTYRAPTGYIFFDIFNQNSVQNPVLRSSTIPALEGQAERCLSFWFAPFGRGESSTLSVFQAPEAPPAGDDGATNGNAAAPRTLLWRLSTRRMDTSRPDWRYGQVKVAAEAPFKIHFEGEATDGGFALDDITMYEGNCETRPPTAIIPVASTDV